MRNIRARKEERKPSVEVRSSGGFANRAKPAANKTSASSILKVADVDVASDGALVRHLSCLFEKLRLRDDEGVFSKPTYESSHIRFFVLAFRFRFSSSSFFHTFLSDKIS